MTKMYLGTLKEILFPVTILVMIIDETLRIRRGNEGVMAIEITDERYFVAEEAIHDAFLLLLKEKNMDKITVTDVIMRAGLVRSTFYNHYKNIPDLITAIEDKTIEDIFSFMEKFHPQNDRDICYNYFLTLCRYTQTNLFLAELLRLPRGNDFLEKALTMFHHYVTGIMENASAFHHSKNERSYAIAYTIGGTIGILHKWTCEHFEVPIEIVADILTQTFITGAFPLIS